MGKTSYAFAWRESQQIVIWIYVRLLWNSWFYLAWVPLDSRKCRENRSHEVLGALLKTSFTHAIISVFSVHLSSTTPPAFNGVQLAWMLSIEGCCTWFIIVIETHTIQWADKCGANCRGWIWCRTPRSSSRMGSSCLQGTEVYYHQRTIKVCSLQLHGFLSLFALFEELQ